MIYILSNEIRQNGRNMDKKQISIFKIFKIIFIAILIILLHLAVILVSIHLYKYFSTQGDMKWTKEYIESDVINEDNLEGMIFEYELTYDLSNGSKKEFNGKETYYWNGCELVPISEFMKAS